MTRWLGFIAMLLGAIAPVVQAAELMLAVELRWNGAGVAVPSAEVKNASAQSLRLTRVAALISGVTLVKLDGGSVRLEGQYGLLDFERGRTEVRLRGVPDGDYAGIEFQIGLPPEVNHDDASRWPAGHPLNPLVNALHWSWQGGYVFLALEGRWLEAAGGNRVEEERGFLYHVATDARRMTVRFAADYRVERTTTVRLAFDAGRALQEQRLAAEDGSESTHSADDDELATRLAAVVERAWFWLEVVEGARVSEGNFALEGRRVRDNAPYLTPVAFTVPAGFPQPQLPADNPLTVEGVALGRRLFQDTRLSGNGAQSCVSCHAPERAFSDQVAVSLGARGAAGTRNAMPLFNLAWSDAYAWDGSKPRVRDQSLAAMRNPIEMDGDPDAVIGALARDAEIKAMFAAAFGSEVVTLERIGLALEQFQLTLVAADSRFDRALRGEKELTAEAQRGFELFLTEYDPVRGKTGADCFHCHGGALFTDFGFKNNGLQRRRNVSEDLGRETVTGKAEDRVKFKTPSLRNVAVTAPYMHDGRFATLEQVIAHYSEGVERSPTLDANLAKHPRSGIRLSADDQRALVAFLRTLTEARFEEVGLIAKGRE